jgi:L-asparaginase
MNKRLLIVYTGGTIGMAQSAQGYAPVSGFGEQLAQYLPTTRYPALPEFDVLELETLIDSANLTPADWLRIARPLQQHWQQYDGFVILHGTDTMAYTASALSFILGAINKPVVITGSQIPLVEANSDAVDNLLHSLLLASSDALPEVYLCFYGRVLRGNRSVKVNANQRDAFDSPNYPWLGTVNSNHGCQLPQTQRRLPSTSSPTTPTPTPTPAPATTVSVKPHLDTAAGVNLPAFNLPEFQPDAVTVLTLYPGISADIVKAMLNATPVRAMILRSYGVGNPPDNNQALITALEHASQRGVVILNLSQCQHGRVIQGTYATGATLNRIGVISGVDLTLEAAFAKLHWLLATGGSTEVIRQQIATPICGECSPRIHETG